MSVNPLTAGGPPSDLAAVIAEELATLAADAHTLQSQLATGDVVAAIVLPSNGLTDLLDIGGLRVAAELPPSLVPGEGIMVQVTGFSGDRINLQILPAASPPTGQAAPNGPRVTAGPGPAAAQVPASVSVVPPPRSAQHLGSEPTASAVTAKALPAVPGQAAGVTRPPVAPFARAGTGSFAVPPLAARAVRTVPEGLANIEARLATARATVTRPMPPNPARAATPPPNVAAARVPAKPPTVSPVVVPRPPVVARALNAPPPVATGPAAGAARGPASYAEPAALLRALQLPVTPSNVAAARLALESPERLPNALEALEHALSSSTDPHLATLRTIVGFIARVEPTSPVLAAQVAAFVDQVVAGREGKLAQLLDAHAQADAGKAAGRTAGAAADLRTSTPSAAQPASGAAASTPGQAAVTTASGVPPPLALAAERVVIRQAALDFDLKTQLLAVVTDARGTTGSASPALTAAVTGALTALTALQLNATSALAANPDGFAFALPIALPTGFTRAHVRVDRDAPRAQNVALDGDNFHIAFVLETQHLGTVAIDLVTVGRSVTLGVKTEAELAQRVFAGALVDLKRRLETLRYRVTKADATVAPRGSVEFPAAAAPSPVTTADPARMVDLDA